MPSIKKHVTKYKGDLAVAKTILDLTNKGYTVFTPAISEHSSVDLIAYDNERNTCIRVQVKYSVSGQCSHGTVRCNTKGTVVNKYPVNAFDCYAMYLPEKDVIVYPTLKTKAFSILTELPNAYTPFYWYEDFLQVNSSHKKRRRQEFKSTPVVRKESDYVHPHSIYMPDRETLFFDVWDKPSIHLKEKYKVTDSAIGGWCKRLDVPKPPRGFWKKSQTLRDNIKAAHVLKLM